MKMPPQIQQLSDLGALFVVNHSGGKDSQAMLIRLRRLIPRRQLLIVHADLGRVEWTGAIEHIEATADGLPLIVARARRDLLQMIRERRMFPSPQQRQCTSDLKRGPIEREIRRFLKAHPEFNGRVVNCMGLRAEESAARKRRVAWQRSTRNSKAGREWFDWLPIKDMTMTEVFETIAAAGQKPHPVYAAGMRRFSCCFCIMACVEDLTTAAHLNPPLYREYVALERETGHTLSMSGKGLEEITGVVAEDA